MNTVFAFHNKVFVKTQSLTWTPYFVGIVWTVDDMDSAFCQGIKRWKSIKYFLSID